MADLAYGDATFTRVHESDWAGLPPGLYCDHAEPRVTISPALVSMWHSGDAVPEVSVRCAPDCPIGDVVAVDCVNRRVVYRIIGVLAGWLEGDDQFSYTAEWPD